MASSKNDFSWTVVILLAAFCILGAFGGGFSIRAMVSEHAPWVLAAYAVAGGIFMAISAVVILQILSFSMDS